MFTWFGSDYKQLRTGPDCILSSFIVTRLLACGDVANMVLVKGRTLGRNSIITPGIWVLLCYTVQPGVRLVHQKLGKIMGESQQF